MGKLNEDGQKKEKDKNPCGEMRTTMKVKYVPVVEFLGETKI